MSNRNGLSNIFLMDADGSDVVKLTTDESREANPVWSPDGRFIAFESWRDGGMEAELYLFDTRTQRTQRLTSQMTDDSCLAWSPSGSWISFCSDREGSYDIYLIHPDGSGLTQFTDEPEFDLIMPQFSPDGGYIAYLSDESGARNVHFVSIWGHYAGALESTPDTINHDFHWGP
jgi:Tol biopolymer transport system component